MSKRPTDESAGPGYVYIASTQTLGVNGIHKVGYTNDINRRPKDLSASTSAPEEFFVERFVRCRTLSEAKQLEKAVHKALDGEGARIRKDREFFRTGTTNGIVGCIVETAKNLKISIVHDTTTEPANILASDNQSFLSDENFDTLPRDYQATYLRGARDLAALMMLAFGGQARQAASNLYRRLSDASPEGAAPPDLVAVAINSIRLSHGEDTARHLKNEVRECRDEDTQNISMGDPRYSEEWRNYIRTDLNWPRVDA